VDLTDLWSWPDIPRFQKQSVFDLSGRRFNAAAALGIKDAVLIPNPAGAFSAVRGLVNPGKGWGLRGAWGATDPRVHTGNAPDRPVFLLCHEQRLAQTKPRHGGGLPGAGLAGPPVSREGIKNEGP
jgi:hypothetical protein